MRTKRVRLIPIEEDKAEVTSIKFHRYYVCLEGYTKSSRKRTLVVPFAISKAEQFIYKTPFYPYVEDTYIAVPIIDKGHYLVIIPALNDQAVKEAMHLFDNVFDTHEEASAYIKYNRKENRYDDKTI